MIIKKIGTGQLNNGAGKQPPREDATNQLDSLRNSLGANNTLARSQILRDRYEIEQVIGYGGMSTVYRGRDMHFVHTARICAVKEMFDVSTDPSARKDKIQRFEMEANLLASLNHVSIPKIYDYFNVNERSYLVQEFIDGQNLESVLEATNIPMNERDVLEWSLQICEVLSYLHNRKPDPIVFRDMKPSNVMLTSDGRIMLIDFGIAKVFMDDKKGTMIGTEGYSPPEQYKGLALPVGDIYALGASLHQLLTNTDPRLEIPFTFHERKPRSLNPEVSPGMENIVMKALAFDPAQRWASVEELRAALLKLKSSMGGQVSIGKGAVPTGQVTRDLGIHTTDLQLDMARAAGVTTNNPTARRTEDVMAQANLSPAARRNNAQVAKDANLTIPDNLATTKCLWSFTTEEEIRSTPVVVGNMVFVSSYDTNLYAVDAKTGQFIWKAATTGGLSSTPCIGEGMVIVGSEDYKLYAFDLSKGQKMWEFPTGGPIRSSPRLHTNFAFFGSDDNHVYAVDIRTGKQLWKSRTMGKVRSSPIIFNGKVYIGSEDRNLYALEGSKGQTEWRSPTLGSVLSSPVYSDGFIYFGSDDSYLWCVEAQSGSPVWKAKTDNKIRSSPCFYNGKVYFGSTDGNLYCYEYRKGKKLWAFETGSQIVSTPRVEDGVVYFGAADHNVYALDAEKGHALWFYPTEGAVASSPAVANNVVYIGSLDNRLYALATESRS